MTTRGRFPPESAAIRVRCRPGPDAPWIEGTVANIGPGGFAAHLDAPLDGHAELELFLGERTTLRGHGRVVWSSHGDDGATGFAFVTLDEYARPILELWLSSRTPRTR